MKLEPDDPRLSAWVLGELPASEAQEVERAVAGDPALQAAAAELRGVGDFLSSALAASALRPDQREAVRRAGRAPAANVVEFPVSKKKHRAWPAIAAAAAVVAAGIFVASRYDVDRPASGLSQTSPAEGGENSLAPFPGPRILPAKTSPNAGSHPLARSIPGGPAVPADLASQPLPEVSKLPTTSPLQPLQQAAEIELPLLVGRSSYDWVRGWIREKNELPPRDAVRIEELANAFPLPAAEETREFAGLRVACVSMASLWSGPGRLVGVQIANESPDSKEVTWSFSPAPNSRDGGVRVLASTGSEGKSASILPPGQRTLVLIELASAAGDAGDLVVASGGRSKRFPAMESKDSSLKQAALVAAFGMWLRGEGIDDSRLNQILVAAGEDSNPEWADSRRLMREALGIAAAKR
ncbi:VWA domain-containing protein [Luteolibacter luteus]|uniref:Uncharacterized protein YfbK N-terminal domain-containing protein n=1 Tax=Luteolibacter luteus TaxID=2728835 RepID=A0A858RER1_9BACT|nr:von Willebrand factor type A domain-containing protein [Luteolibacter luteus]QJE95054.1 hypothetical protein HHL09_04460 [Luteolibacter luteus]